MASQGGRGLRRQARQGAHEQGDRASTTDDHGEEEWERISQSVGSASERGSVCGSIFGDDAAVDGLIEDWALIGPIGEDAPAGGWQRNAPVGGWRSNAPGGRIAK